MGLGKFWHRSIVIIVSIILLWQFAKTWNFFYTDVANEPQLQVNQNDNGSLDTRKDHMVQIVVVIVYYEALCPDSRNFIIKQLVPTYQKLLDNVAIELIPYGKATTTDLPNGYKFTCQHGPRECEANMIHACAIDIIKNPTVQVNFIACMIEHNLWPINITRNCAEKMHLDADSILNCTKSSRGPELLAKYGRMTQSLNPPVSFIPTVTLNGNSYDQAAILANLLKEVCKHFKILPAGCL
ncbi:gamma-interferon-inducible lysosomal thiol reductase-like [Chelonus insularis]|uniref:gamma-interferon-inducible lysosomal thiol reductase-like n=1 Tax=Chelonus insularis TaxID=460826 RepID=UPI00158CB9FE|nr:gamma-interferon-inducible lysosomal thiol reductase-like [Chelonus insularis]